MRFGAEGETIDTSDAAVAARYKQDVWESLSSTMLAVQTAPERDRAALTARVDDVREAIDSWIGWTRWADSATFDRWRAEGERIIAELTDIHSAAQGTSGGFGSMALLGMLGLVGLVWWGKRR